MSTSKVRLITSFYVREVGIFINKLEISIVFLGNTDLIFIDAQGLSNSGRIEFFVRKDGFLTIPCKPTHPNVTVYLVHMSLYHGEGIVSVEDFLYKEESWLTDERFIKEFTNVSIAK